jgi:S1-C subfamily serine protease
MRPYIWFFVLVAASGPNYLDDEQNTMRIVKDNVNSVVNVSNVKVARQFFGRGAIEIPAGTGSGFFWDNNGHLVTNYHVVAGGDYYMVTLGNKEQIRATLVGVAPEKDIAVLKLDTIPKGIKPIRPGDSLGLQVGQKTIAIGNPFGFDNTVTTGIVSALGREIQSISQVPIYDMIQTDASINPGNSGGPLFNSSGGLIGMNTIIVSASGSSSGVGFAVPVDTIKRIVPQLIQYGKIIRPIIGIEIRDDITKAFDLDKGVAVLYADSKGPSGKVLRGITRDSYGRYILGDVILAIDDQETNSYNDVYRILEKYQVGDTVTLTVIREEKTIKLKIKLSST